MKSHRAIALCLLLVPAVAAQNVKGETENDPVLEAIQKFKKRDKSKPNEVTVVLFDKDEDPKEDEPTAKAPVLVTPVSKPDDVADPDRDATADDSAVENASPEPETGLAVRVESLRTGKGSVDPATVKLLAPFPAKPLAEPPAGWHLDTSDSAPPFTREVEVSPGTRVTLSIRPHLLVPDADGVAAFGIPEPGYDSGLGYRQTATVGAILATSIRQLDDDAKQLDRALDRLNQLLVSLPTPDPEPKATRKR
jgi:hypothetical protein